MIAAPVAQFGPITSAITGFTKASARLLSDDVAKLTENPEARAKALAALTDARSHAAEGQKQLASATGFREGALDVPKAYASVGLAHLNETLAQFKYAPADNIAADASRAQTALETALSRLPTVPPSH